MPYDLVIVSKRFYHVSWLLVCDQHLFPSLIISNFDRTEMEQQQIGFNIRNNHFLSNVTSNGWAGSTIYHTVNLSYSDKCVHCEALILHDT